MKRDFDALGGEVDLLICGGGIYGAWTAYDAALRGLRVVLVEQGDWASGTSSASTKLIHGGLRYLETLDLKLVRKALHERQRLLRLAPHRVWPLRFGVPVYADSRNGMWKLKAGLTLYDHLAGASDAAMAHRRFDAAAFAARFPFLGADRLEGGYTYGDAQTDDARLVLELVAGAQAAGAVCVNYCKAEDFIERGGLAVGAILMDGCGSARVQLSARQIVDTRGHWLGSSMPGREWCRLTRGVHLVMPALPDSEAVLLTNKADGRVFFIIPWCGRSLLGATDTDYRGDPDQVAAEPADITYLLEAARPYMKMPWTERDIIAVTTGVRVMKRASTVNPSALSRDWELHTTPDGVHHSVGGKITSAREDAAHIVDVVCAQLGIASPCATVECPLPWTPPGDFAAWMAGIAARAEHLGVDAESALWLARRHGRRAAAVLDLIEDDTGFAARIDPDLPFIAADLLFCARNEMVVRQDDLLRRRLPLDILSGLDGRLLRQIATDLTGLPQ